MSGRWTTSGRAADRTAVEAVDLDTDTASVRALPMRQPTPNPSAQATPGRSPVHHGLGWAVFGAVSTYSWAEAKEELPAGTAHVIPVSNSARAKASLREKRERFLKSLVGRYPQSTQVPASDCRPR